MKEHIREGVRSQSEESASQDHQETVKRRKMLPSAKAATAVAEVQVLRGRGRSRREAPPQAFLHSRVHGEVIECGRRRKRNRAGRYVLEYQVAYGTVADGPVGKRWLDVDKFKALLDAGKLEDELGGDGE
ncbi:hypothetical protein PInf_002871 [Phytophthora infestans]|nr:hypothetical protein PInf_002871 [Phytophthora infestans]